MIRLHILHHAVKEPIYGLAIIEELGRHGYKLGPGTLYPVLHGLEKKGYLASRREGAGRSTRRIYEATPLVMGALPRAVAMAADEDDEVARRLVAEADLDAGVLPEAAGIGHDFIEGYHEQLAGFEGIVEKVAGLELRLGIYDLAQFTPQ